MCSLYTIIGSLNEYINYDWPISFTILSQSCEISLKVQFKCFIAFAISNARQYVINIKDILIDLRLSNDKQPHNVYSLYYVIGLINTFWNIYCHWFFELRKLCWLLYCNNVPWNSNENQYYYDGKGLRIAI